MRFTFVMPVANAPDGSRPSVCWTKVLGTFHVALRDEPLVAELSPIPMSAFGTDRRLALTRTSTFGIVYDASALNVVRNGSVMSHELMGWLTPSTARSASGSAAYNAQVLTTPRPVVVPA